MKQFILILLTALNIYSLINISLNYQHDDLIALLSSRIILLAVSIILPVLFFIVGTSRSVKILAVISILSGLAHFLMIALIYI